MDVSSRITPGPLERLMLSNPDLYPNHETAVLALNQIRDMRRMRSSRGCREFPVLAVETGDLFGRLVLIMRPPTEDYLMGNAAMAEVTAIRLEFERFTISEMQERLPEGGVRRRTALATDIVEDEQTIATKTGQPVDVLLVLPDALRSIFDGLLIKEGQLRGEGTCYEFT